LSLPSGFVLSGLGRSVADVAYFRRSPDAEVDGPLATTEVDDLRFALVARPLERDSTVAEAIVMRVRKHHSMLFQAGRTIDVLELGDGLVMVPAWAPAEGSVDRGDPEFPVGWSRRRVDLEADLLVEIPNPATVLIGHDGSGFHGPLSALSLPTHPNEGTT
jgi:hypothetical protein